MANDVVWQCHWWIIVNLSIRGYNATISRVVCRFVKKLTDELKGVYTRDCNFEHLLVFESFILSTMKNIRFSKNICLYIVWKMDLWDHDGFMALVENTAMDRQG